MEASLFSAAAPPRQERDSAKRVSMGIVSVAVRLPLFLLFLPLLVAGMVVLVASRFIQKDQKQTGIVSLLVAGMVVLVASRFIQKDQKQTGIVSLAVARLPLLLSV
jgi:hypothetical protein